jgi:hypothetical protein
VTKATITVPDYVIEVPDSGIKLIEGTVVSPCFLTTVAGLPLISDFIHDLSSNDRRNAPKV